VLLGAVCLLALAGLRWWNWLALAATIASLGLIVAVVVAVEPTASPIALEVPPPERFLTLVTALMGYVAVFGLRSPDFTVGLARTSDVAWPAGLMVGITIGVAAAGVAVWASSGDSDVITVIAERIAVGNALLLLAVVPAMLTSFHSGRMALVSATGLPMRLAATVVALAGLLLGVLRFDQHLVVWLGVLSVVLVPIMVPLAAEVWRRRHGGPRRPVPTWCWAPGSAVGAAGVLAGWHLALAAAVALTAVLTVAAPLPRRIR
jgi:cytosine permease